MFEKYDEDVTGFAMFKFKNPADFYAWTDRNPEFAEGDYIYIDPTQPFMGSTCDTGYGEGIVLGKSMLTSSAKMANLW